MILGHACIAVSAKKFRRAIPLLLLIVVAYLPDFLGLFLPHRKIRGVGWPHALVVILLMSAICAVLWWRVTHNRNESLILFVVGVSHWPLDALSAAKPIWPGSHLVGLRLYDRSIVFVIATELLFIAVTAAYITADARRLRRPH